MNPVRNIVIEKIVDSRIEMAERKGIGHPDTVCDAITEQVSIELCKYYLNEFGSVMHHNVDKALLIGGQSQPAYLGGRVTKPISLIIAGRATHRIGDKTIPVEEIAVETAKTWLAKNIRHLDVSRDVEIFAHIRPGSAELVELFRRFGTGETPLANDSSFGAGFYPMTTLEENIIQIEDLLNSPAAKIQLPYIGEDIKVMGVQDRSIQHYTIAIAVVDRYVAGLNDYISKIKTIEKFVRDSLPLHDARIYINTADDYERESIYLTVTGTSAESGDDGQVGRGNRINGLITPYRPMSLEATAGKNPVSHVGKIYNYFARDLSRTIIEHQLAEAARVFIVSQISKPIDEPQLLHIQLEHQQVDSTVIEALAKDRLRDIPQFWKSVVYPGPG